LHSSHDIIRYIKWQKTRPDIPGSLGRTNNKVPEHFN
jgi:hypothetical protein